MAQKHLNLGKESIERWEDLQAWAKTHHSQLQELTTTVPQQVQEQLVETLSQHISEVTQQHFMEHVKEMQGLLSDQMASVMNSQLANHKSALNEVLMELTEEQRNHHLEMIELAKKQKEAWNERIAYWQTNIQRVVDKQTESVQAILNKVNHLQDRWQNTAVEIGAATMTWVLRNMVILFNVFFFLAWQFVTWILLTRPTICRKARKKVLLISVMSAATLLYMKLFSQGEVSTGLDFEIPWGEDHNLNHFDLSFGEADLRRVTSVAQALIYCYTILVHLFFKKTDHHDDLEDYDDVPMPEPFVNRFALQPEDHRESSSRNEEELEFHNQDHDFQELRTPTFSPRTTNSINNVVTSEHQYSMTQERNTVLDQDTEHHQRLPQRPVYPTPTVEHRQHLASPTQNLCQPKGNDQPTSTPQQQPDAPVIVPAPVPPAAKIPATKQINGSHDQTQTEPEEANSEMDSEYSESENEMMSKNHEDDDMSTTSSDGDDEDMDDNEKEELQKKKRSSHSLSKENGQHKRQRVEVFEDAIQFEE